MVNAAVMAAAALAAEIRGDKNDTDNDNNHMAVMVGSEDSAVDGVYCTDKDNPVSVEASVWAQIAYDIW